MTAAALMAACGSSPSSRAQSSGRFAKSAWLGLNGNSVSYLGPVGQFAADRISFDREEYRAGELPTAHDGLARAMRAGMIPVVVIEYPGYDSRDGVDPRFPRGARIADYVQGFLRTATAILRAYPGRRVLFEAINEPYYRASAADYAAVMAQLLPAAREAGIPPGSIYAAAFGQGWVPAMYAAQPSLRTLVGGWNFHPYGPPSGALAEDSAGIQSLPYVRRQMDSGRDNIIVSEIGWCVRNVNHGQACGTPTASTAGQAALDLTRALENALAMHRAGWLKALLVYSRNDGGWAMELPGGRLTPPGRALVRFALAHPAG